MDIKNKNAVLGLACKHTIYFIYLVRLFTCVVSASCLLHPDGLDGVLLPLFPVAPVLFQSGCGEEASALHRCTKHLRAQLSLSDCLPKQKATRCIWYCSWWLSGTVVSQQKCQILEFACSCHVCVDSLLLNYVC